MNCKVLLLVLLLVGCSDLVSDDTLTDGPYVQMQANQWEALWVCQGQRKSYRFPPPVQDMSIEKCGQAAQLSPLPASRPDVAYPAAGKLAVISDIHGQFELFKRLLVAHQIMDAQGNWLFGEGQLVISGDVFDRGPKQTEALWLIYQLQQQAQATGGKVHFLLGNHETMVLNGDLRYLNEKYEKVANLLNRPFARLYGEDTLLGQWLRTRNVLVKIGDMLFLHGGLHPELAREGRTLADINQVFTGQLVEDQDQPRQGFARYLHKTNGPIWYRGYFKDPQASQQDINLLKQHFGVAHILVGHTTQRHIRTLYNGDVIAIDSGIKGGESGEILLLEGQNFYRGSPNGSRQRLE